VAEITPQQVHELLTATRAFIETTDRATTARDTLGRTFLDVARQAKVGLKDLTAVTGLHPSTIRAAIRRAAGPGHPDRWEQPELGFSRPPRPIQPAKPTRYEPLVTVPAPAPAAPSL
jgi:hypothetical protein